MEISDLINTATRNEYALAEPSNQGCISDSLINEYVPFFSAFSAEFKRVGQVRYSIYQTPATRVSGSYTSNKIAHFKQYIARSISSIGYLKGEHRYEVMKNCIFTRGVNGERDKMLYCLAIKTEYLFDRANINFDQLDYTKLIILLDKNFTEAPDRRLMYNFVKREVIQPLTDLGIDVVITNDVNRWCFKDSASPVTFNTMSEMREFLNNLSNNIIDGITGRERPAEIAQPASEPETTEADALRIFDELLRGGDSEYDAGGEGVADDSITEQGDIREQINRAIEAELEADRNRREATELNRELTLGRAEDAWTDSTEYNEFLARQRDQLLDEILRLTPTGGDLATERGEEIHEGMAGRIEQFPTTTGIGGETFTIPFRAEDFTNFNILQQPPTSPTGRYAAGIDPYQPETAEGIEPHRVLIRERTGIIDENGRPQERYRFVEPNLTGGIDISYGARRREDIVARDPRDPIRSYNAFLDYRGQGNSPATPDNRRMFERFEVREERQELSREDLWSLPGRETQSSEETQERDESANPLEDDGLPY